MHDRDIVIPAQSKSPPPPPAAGKQRASPRPVAVVPLAEGGLKIDYPTRAKTILVRS